MPTIETQWALDARYQETVKKNDVATMARILADDCVLVAGNGRKQTKADLLKDSSSRVCAHAFGLAVRVWPSIAAPAGDSVKQSASCPCSFVGRKQSSKKDRLGRSE